jgi:hypothetical protein
MRQRGIQKRSQSFINVRVLECHYRKHQNTCGSKESLKIIANKLGVKIGFDL